MHLLATTSRYSRRPSRRFDYRATKKDPLHFYMQKLSIPGVSRCRVAMKQPGKCPPVVDVPNDAGSWPPIDHVDLILLVSAPHVVVHVE